MVILYKKITIDIIHWLSHSQINSFITISYNYTTALPDKVKGKDWHNRYKPGMVQRVPGS